MCINKEIAYENESENPGTGLDAGAARPGHGLSITTYTNGSTLANSLLGAGVTISNITLIGGSTQQGFFSGGAASGIGSGVILTSGNANLAPGPNTSDSAG